MEADLMPFGAMLFWPVVEKISNQEDTPLGSGSEGIPSREQVADDTEIGGTRRC